MLADNNGKYGGHKGPLRSGKILVGMNAIADYWGRDRKTGKGMIEKDGFPATMVNVRWESHTDLIDNYKYRRIAAATGNMQQDAC